MNKKDGAQDVKKIKKIKKVDVDGEKGSFFFVALVGLLVVGAVGGVLFLAAGRESVIGIAPEAGADHWHLAYSVNNCGDTLSYATIDTDPDGIHTHGRGLIHIHPFRPGAAGPNAQLGLFFEAFGGELTDDSYTPGPSEEQVTLSEEAGCDGKPATLKLAYWEDAFDRDAEPTEILEENLADFKFEKENGMITLALVAEGEEIPRPGAERIKLLAETGGLEYELTDQELLGVDPAETEAEADSSDTTMGAAEADSTDDADADAEADSTDDADADSTDTTEG